MDDILIEALTMDGNVVAVNVVVSGVPCHYLPKTTAIDGATPIGPCEIWLDWGHRHHRIFRRALDESYKAVAGS